MPFLTHPSSHISGLKISTRSKLAWGLSLESWRTCIVKISKSTLSHFSFLHVLHSFILIISLLLDFPHLSVTKLFTGNFDFIWAIHPTCDVKLLFLLSYFTLFSDLYLLSHHSPCVSSLCSIIPFLTFPTPIFTPSTWFWYFLFLTSLWCFFSLFFLFKLFFSLRMFLVWCPSSQAWRKVNWTSEVLRNNNNRMYLAKRTHSEFHYCALDCVYVCACVRKCICWNYGCPWDRSQPLKLQTASISTSKVGEKKIKFSKLFPQYWLGENLDNVCVLLSCDDICSFVWI